MASIRNYQLGRRIPHCSYELELLAEKIRHRLRHKVDVKGVISPKSFTIRYNPECELIIKKLLCIKSYSILTIFLSLITCIIVHRSLELSASLTSTSSVSSLKSPTSPEGNDT